MANKREHSRAMLMQFGSRWMFDALMQIEARLMRIEDKLDLMAARANANGIQAATWTTPKSWAKAQKRPPPQERS